MKKKSKLSVIFLLLVCLNTIANADTGVGISNVGTISSITSIEDENILLSVYCLYQNYPNPFNPSTKISWQSPVGSWQTIKVFDVLGREVGTLVDEYKPAGSYEGEFNVAHESFRVMASGVYFYRLKAGSFTQTKKMIYLK